MRKRGEEREREKASKKTSGESISVNTKERGPRETKEAAAAAATAAAAAAGEKKWRRLLKQGEREKERKRGGETAEPGARSRGPHGSRHARALPGWPGGARSALLGPARHAPHPGATQSAHARASAWVAFAGRTVPRRERAAATAAPSLPLLSPRPRGAPPPPTLSNKLPICQLRGRRDV